MLSKRLAGLDVQYIEGNVEQEARKPRCTVQGNVKQETRRPRCTVSVNGNVLATVGKFLYCGRYVTVRRTRNASTLRCCIFSEVCYDNTGVGLVQVILCMLDGTVGSGDSRILTFNIIFTFRKITQQRSCYTEF